MGVCWEDKKSSCCRARSLRGGKSHDGGTWPSGQSITRREDFRIFHQGFLFESKIHVNKTFKIQT